MIAIAAGVATLSVAAASSLPARAVASDARSAGRAWHSVGHARHRHDQGAAALAHDRWRVLARSPIGSPAGASVVWDGSALLEIGGGNPGGQRRERRTGAAFDPRSGRWRTIATAPTSVLTDGASTVWTGRALFVFGASEPPGPPPTGIAGLYDPSSNNWTVTSPAPVRLPSNGVAAVWSGKRVILAAIHGNGTHAALESAAYDPATGLWQKLKLSPPAGHYPLAVEMVATNRGVLAWSLWSRGRRISANGFVIYSGVDVFRLRTGRWRSVTGAWPQHRTVDQPLFTGSRVLLGANQIWCGACSHPAPVDANGWSVNPATLAVTRLAHGPLDDIQPQILWSGSAEIALDIGGEIKGPHVDVLPGDIGFLDTGTGHWYRGPRAPHAPGPAAAVWDGSHVLVLDQHGELLSYGP
ncbi:MAG: hypothetical protein KGL16_13635 [Acidobacteriota bacterium]|nr:hypothetical protein [Acidobacteriota bacterium]